MGEEALQANRLTLDLQFVYEWPIGNGEEVYEMHVPVKQLFDSGFKKSTTYEFKPSANRKGKLKFSYQFGERLVGVAPALPYLSAVSVAPPLGMEPVMGYPVGPASTSANFSPSAPYLAAVEEEDISCLHRDRVMGIRRRRRTITLCWDLGLVCWLVCGCRNIGRIMVEDDIDVLWW